MRGVGVRTINGTVIKSGNTVIRLAVVGGMYYETVLSSDNQVFPATYTITGEWARKLASNETGWKVIRWGMDLNKYL